MNESTLKKRLIESLKSLNAWVYPTRDMIRRGIPDILAIIPKGKFVVIEVKFERLNKPKPKLSKLQMKALMDIAERGGYGIIWYFSEYRGVVRSKVYQSKRIPNLYEVITSKKPLIKNSYSDILLKIVVL